jgi:hypothetical protein
MEERRRTFWAILLAPMLLAGLAATPARADLLVNRLSQEQVASNDTAPSCTVTQEQAKAEPMTTASVDENALALTVLATVLFSNPDNSSPQTSGNGGGGGTTPSGGTNPPPTSEAPEPATLLSALVGTGLAGLFAAFRRKRLTGGEAKPTV